MKLSQAKLAVLANLDPSTVNQIEVGARQPNTKTLEKIAAVLEVDVADLFPRAQFPLPFEDASSLEELHAQAGCATDWLIKPEDEWIATWHQNLTPREAIRIVRETAAEWDSVKPRSGSHCTCPDFRHPHDRFPATQARVRFAPRSAAPSIRRRRSVAVSTSAQCGSSTTGVCCAFRTSSVCARTRAVLQSICEKSSGRDGSCRSENVGMIS